MNILLEDARQVVITTNDDGEHLKLRCSVCDAETYVSLPSTLAVLMAMADTHAHAR